MGKLFLHNRILLNFVAVPQLASGVNWGIWINYVLHFEDPFIALSGAATLKISGNSGNFKIVSSCSHHDVHSGRCSTNISHDIFIFIG